MRPSYDESVPQVMLSPNATNLVAPSAVGVGATIPAGTGMANCCNAAIAIGGAVCDGLVGVVVHAAVRAAININAATHGRVAQYKPSHLLYYSMLPAGRFAVLLTGLLAIAFAIADSAAPAPLDHGLLARYYANNSWSGAPIIEQIESEVSTASFAAHPELRTPDTVYGRMDGACW